MSTARQRKANLMLLGWPGYTSSRDRAFGSIIDLISQDPPCDVAVVRFRRPWDVPKRILVPSRGAGPNARMAFEMARDIARFYAQPEHGSHEVRIEALHVNIARHHVEEVMQFRDQIKRLSRELQIDVEPVEIDADDVVSGIVEAGKGVDLVIMGASEQGLFEQRLFGNIPEQVMRETPATIIMCKRYRGEVVSWLRRLFLPQPVDLTDPLLAGVRRGDHDEVENAVQVMQSAARDGDDKA